MEVANFENLSFAKRHFSAVSSTITITARKFVLVMRFDLLSLITRASSSRNLTIFLSVQMKLASLYVTSQ